MEERRLVIRYALPNDDGTYDLYQIAASEEEGLLLSEKMGVEILRNFDVECGRNVLKMGLPAAVAYWIEQDRKSHEGRLLRDVEDRSLVAHNVRVLARDEDGVDKK